MNGVVGFLTLGFAGMHECWEVVLIGVADLNANYSIVGVEVNVSTREVELFVVNIT